ncbi:G2/mitotic-specific cyclin cdc13 [Choanephora cucurbitarum]|uniref:G2/mitotic-specific cyclin cdc13 n=1 Tax=Choanephora cucurbitarum TaxID=101091 RepID=A0A1C7NB87_9FUNG|nr:G2/mitotic-specific cyclin cdc13 [Choanephora cucurbitarum]
MEQGLSSQHENLMGSLKSAKYNQIDLKKAVFDTKLMPSQRSRAILLDKSNDSIQKAPYESNAKKVEKLVVEKDTLNVIDDDEYKPYVLDFYETNKQEKEEEEKEEEFPVVPVLPIEVPDHMKHLFFPQRPNHKHALHEEERRDSKRIKINIDSTTTSSSSWPLLNSSHNDLEFKATEEAVLHDKQQEERAKQAMLQTTQSLREDQWNDPMLMAEYAGEIFGHLYDSEPNTMADPNYSNLQQHEVTWGMRSVLIDWIIEIHFLFGLLPETLFLTVNIIDRFLSQRTVVLGKLQLVGITALFIAAKFEELSTPPMHDFLFMTDNAVSEEELIKAERFILQVLDFKLCYPNPLNFLRRVCTEEMNCDIHTRTLAKYFMEASCIDHRFIGVRPSLIAAASLWLAKRMLAKGKWNTSLTKLSGYAPEDLKSTVELMLDYLAQPVTHDAFFRKWSTKRCAKASIFVRDWINRYYVNNK